MLQQYPVRWTGRTRGGEAEHRVKNTCHTSPDLHMYVCVYLYGRGEEGRKGRRMKEEERWGKWGGGGMVPRGVVPLPRA